MKYPIRSRLQLTSIPKTKLLSILDFLNQNGIDLCKSDGKILNQISYTLKLENEIEISCSYRHYD